MSHGSGDTSPRLLHGATHEETPRRKAFVPLALLVLLAAGGRSLVLDAQGQVPAQAPAQLKGQAQAQVTPPEAFFGFQMGADRKMARWDKLVEYYRLLEKEGGGG